MGRDHNLLSLGRHGLFDRTLSEFINPTPLTANPVASLAYVSSLLAQPSATGPTLDVPQIAAGCKVSLKLWIQQHSEHPTWTDVHRLIIGNHSANIWFDRRFPSWKLVEGNGGVLIHLIRIPNKIEFFEKIPKIR
eukprot:SAG11_NODE_749_length_7363_cov_12.270099_2_plen_135_part_00